MEPPFPGMDPYLEAPSVWPDVHQRLISELSTQIQGQVGPRYAAVITPYIAFESIDIAPVRMAVRDIGVVERDAPSEHSPTVALADAPLVGTAVMAVPTRYARLEIRTVGDEALVTAIELLSSGGSRGGAEGGHCSPSASPFQIAPEGAMLRLKRNMFAGSWRSLSATSRA